MSLSLGRLRVRRTSKPEPDPEGRMALVEHLRELRSRLFKAVGAILLGMILGWIFYPQLFDLLREPLDMAIRNLKVQRNVDVKLVFGDVAGPLMLQLKVALIAGLVASSPVWLYQLWAFILPGLHRNERKWTMVFMGSAAPLFIGGVVVGYYAMPKGLNVLIDFTPAGVSNYPSVDLFLSFVLRLLLVFGVAFEIPVFVVMLNLVGVLSSATLARSRAWIIFGIFVFAAVATPSTDPVTMLILAVPMTILFLVSEQIARLTDRRRKARLVAQGIDVDGIERAGRDD
ncbi:sec-independent protein translocase protein TatC [Actinopolymorpha cephalotaxi]|uniref:Sec-independent protein translocase protein TatC n=1 Tax=Actinopolymorpha cephalotaxi TaxID=504797 RepID=A0A1I2T925_9ACTN|nr:twin-arginine translocase subunit TatC [Actinopolymorpha cephalotaxi]NYH82903.1 sec-independent protein translocase protein TatC [Actinopolymorpha cephalotaxi]SFG58851.1 sec-independent protein translocase protein TatC [Actinopolymorpha cephalotaxi]